MKVVFLYDIYILGQQTRLMFPVKDCVMLPVWGLLCGTDIEDIKFGTGGKIYRTDFQRCGIEDIKAGTRGKIYRTDLSKAVIEDIKAGTGS